MGRKPAEVKTETVSEETAPATETPTVETPKRETVKKKYVLDTNVNVPALEVIKKGERISGNDARFSNIKIVAPNSFKQAAVNLFELTEDVTIQIKKVIPVGTILDPVKDKDIFDSLKDVLGGIKEIEG